MRLPETEEIKMSFDESDLLPISALQHVFFCERQCALIHVEQVWAENLYTAEGRILHENVDTGGCNSRGDVRVAYSLPLRSLRIGLVGKADVVEFHREKSEDDKEIWRPFPVEYKRGKAKKDACDKIQLCAQALCLEEMLGCEVPEGALYYGKPHRRLSVIFDDGLRRETERTAERLHELIRSGKTPPARYEKKCESCSLLDQCMPKIAGETKSVTGYISRMLKG